MNPDFIRLSPVSDSEMVCVSCGHLFDEKFRVCTCITAEQYRQFGIEDAKQPIRKIMYYPDYVKDKFQGK